MSWVRVQGSRGRHTVRYFSKYRPAGAVGRGGAEGGGGREKIEM